jgi:hypothetical protein
VGDIAQLRLTWAALADALRNIPSELAPCRSASLVALREQVYYGWEQLLARAWWQQMHFDDKIGLSFSPRCQRRT